MLCKVFWWWRVFCQILGQHKMLCKVFWWRRVFCQILGQQKMLCKVFWWWRVFCQILRLQTDRAVTVELLTVWCRFQTYFIKSSSPLRKAIRYFDDEEYSARYLGNRGWRLCKLFSWRRVIRQVTWSKRRVPRSISVQQRVTGLSPLNCTSALFLSFFLLSWYRPDNYNRTGWLGVKHQLTYLLYFHGALSPHWNHKAY